jgi:hypothetical protein
MIPDDGARLITREILHIAIQQATPKILAVLNTDGKTWGPKYLDYALILPHFKDIFSFRIGKTVSWQEVSWGKWDSKHGVVVGDFTEVATKKAQLSKRGNASTAWIAENRPQLIQKDEFDYPGGDKLGDGIHGGASGAYGPTDAECLHIFRDTLANVVLNIMSR